MAFKRPTLGFRNLSALETIALCERTAQNLQQLPAEHLRDVRHEELTATVAAVRASHQRIAGLRGELRAEITRRNDLLKTIRQQTAAAAGMAAVNMGNDPVQMLATGLPLTADKTSAGVPAAPENLRAAPTASEGEVSLRWVRSLMRCAFEVQAQAGPLHDDGWKTVETCLRQKTVVPGLASGAKFWFRVRAVNAHGPGPWSNLASARVK